MYQDAAGCAKMQQDVRGCSRMQQDAAECSRMQQDEPGFNGMLTSSIQPFYTPGRAGIKSLPCRAGQPFDTSAQTCDTFLFKKKDIYRYRNTL